MKEFKGILLAPFRFVDSLLDRICAVIGAAAFAQFPSFLAQYLQRLGGHRDEAARNIGKYREIAGEIGMTVREYAGRLASSADDVIARTGRKIAEDVDRLDALTRALQDLRDAPPYSKCIVFVKNADFDIVRAVWGDFTPGLPLTTEGAAYAAAGVVAGMVLYFCVKKLLILVAGKIVARKKGNQAPPGNTYREVSSER
ncbi:MAG: DUF2937 family protein [Chrysiogenales bacterium]|nr:MAG: DUF2937 family protein [Chrysiogenales bacterium]